MEPKKKPIQQKPSKVLNIEMTKPKSSTAKGFTLIEIAIVAMILGLIFSAIFATYFTALKITRNANPTKGNTRKDLIFALENIRSTLTRIYYIDGQRRLLFLGKGEGSPGERIDRMSFSATHPNSEETDSISVREVSFYLKKPDSIELFDLIRREDSMVDATPLNGGIEHKILQNVKSLQFKYSERGDKWSDEWNSRTMKKIPKLIRIEIIALVGNQYIKVESLAHPGILFK